MNERVKSEQANERTNVIIPSDILNCEIITTTIKTAAAVTMH